MEVEQGVASMRNWLSIGAGLELERRDLRAARSDELAVSAALAEAAVAQHRDQAGQPGPS